MSVSELADLPLSSVEESLQGLADAGSDAIDPQWWESLRSLAVSRYQAAGRPDEERLRWGDVAIRAIHAKARTSADDLLPPLAEEVRVIEFLLTQVESDSVRSRYSPDALALRARDVLGDSPDALMRQAENWRSAPIESIRYLRKVKNLLSALRPVSVHISDPVLRTWATETTSIIPNLP